MNRTAGLLGLLGFTALLIAAEKPDKPERPFASRAPISESAYLRLIDQVDVPAKTAGALRSVDVREGAVIREGDLVARLDDDDAVMAETRAGLDVEVARGQAENRSAVDAAKAAIAEATAAFEKARLEEGIASRRAVSDFTVRYARKAALVAQAELSRALAAREKLRDSVSQNEIEHLQLAFDKATHEQEQAEHDFFVAGQQNRIRQAEIVGFEAAVKRREQELKQAEHDLEISNLGLKVREHDLAVARREVEQMRLKSPLGGVVAQVHRKPGEWVQPGDKVLRILRLDRLRAEGFVSAAALPPDPMGQPARVVVTLPDQSKSERKGTVVFASPEIDPVNGQVMVWVEIDNPGPAFIFRPGMRATILITPPDAR